jgi:hypothetical protein
MLVSAFLLSATAACAQVGGGVAAFDRGTLVTKLGFKATGTQNYTAGRYKGMTAHQYMSADARCFIDLIVSPRGVIVEQAILLPIAPGPMDATRFVEFMRDAAHNTANMNDVFKFIGDAVKARKDTRKQFGRYLLTLSMYPEKPAPSVLDIQVTLASGGGAKPK